jgi:hypothetical protein
MDSEGNGSPRYTYRRRAPTINHFYPLGFESQNALCKRSREKPDAENATREDCG